MRRTAKTLSKTDGLEAEISQVQAMITPYLEQDTSAFYDMEEFEKAVDMLKTFAQNGARASVGSWRVRYLPPRRGSRATGRHWWTPATHLHRRYGQHEHRRRLWYARRRRLYPPPDSADFTHTRRHRLHPPRRHGLYPCRKTWVPSIRGHDGIPLAAVRRMRRPTPSRWKARQIRQVRRRRRHPFSDSPPKRRRAGPTHGWKLPSALRCCWRRF